MQDRSSGEMVPVSENFARALEQGMRAECESRGVKFLGVKGLLHIGEEVKIKGARFRVAAIGKRFVRLESLPETERG